MIISNELAKQLKEKYNAEGTVLRSAQLRMLEMLQFIDSICRANNITYWIEGGTLLGAVRHGGFIPWDDDADICMPYKDAEKFKEIMLKKNNNKQFVIQCKETDKGFFGAWYVLRDLNSEYIINSKLHNKQKYRGLQVDIFFAEDRTITPLWSFSRFVQRCIDKPLNMIKNYRIACTISYPLYFFMHNILIPFSRFLSKEKNYYKMPYGSMWKFNIMKKQIYPIRNYVFEGYELCAPNNVEAYLAIEFGNWQDVPQNIWTHNATIEIKQIKNIS